MQRRWNCPRGAKKATLSPPLRGPTRRLSDTAKQNIPQFASHFGKLLTRKMLVSMFGSTSGNSLVILVQKTILSMIAWDRNSGSLPSYRSWVNWATIRTKNVPKSVVSYSSVWCRYWPCKPEPAFLPARKASVDAAGAMAQSVCPPRPRLCGVTWNDVSSMCYVVASIMIANGARSILADSKILSVLSLFIVCFCLSSPDKCF